MKILKLSIIIASMSIAFIACSQGTKNTQQITSTIYTIGGLTPEISLDKALQVWGPPEEKHRKQFNWSSSRYVYFDLDEKIVQISGTSLEENGKSILKTGDSISTAKRIFGKNNLTEDPTAPIMKCSNADSNGHRVSFSYRTSLGRFKTRTQVVDAIYLTK